MDSKMSITNQMNIRESFSFERRVTEFLSVDELLCLQLQGYSCKDILQNAHLKDYIITGSQLYLKKARLIIEKQTIAGISTIPVYDNRYPPKLIESLKEDAPLLLHVLGDLNITNAINSVAVIGSRKADKKGENASYHIANKLSISGHIIVSGLALGCDTAAHRGCLDAGGKTIAVVASGLDITYPKENRKLQDDIVNNGGLLVSEHPFGVKANPTRLVSRCRIQVGLSKSVIVAESSFKSGTMYAVHFAQKYLGNNIYAVEYDKYDDNNLGNKYLIEQGIAEPITIE